MENENFDIVETLIEGDNRSLPSDKVSHAIAIKKEALLEASKEESKEEVVMKEVETNLRVVIEYGNSAIQQLSDLLDSQENSKGYDSLARLMNSVTAANNSLLNVRKKEKSQILPNEESNPDKSSDGIKVSATVSEMLASIIDDKDTRGTKAKIIDNDFEDL